MAALLHLAVREAQDQEALVTAVEHWLLTHPHWLAILDNADDVQMAFHSLPPGGKGHVLVTTRAQAVGTIARSLQVEEMDTQEGTLLLLRRVGCWPWRPRWRARRRRNDQVPKPSSESWGVYSGAGPGRSLDPGNRLWARCLSAPLPAAPPGLLGSGSPWAPSIPNRWPPPGHSPFRRSRRPTAQGAPYCACAPSWPPTPWPKRYSPRACRNWEACWNRSPEIH